MVFVIPEERANPANAAAMNIVNLLQQNQQSRTLADMLGIDKKREFASLNPQQQALVIQQQQQQQQAQQKAAADQQLFEMLFPGMAQSQAQSPLAQPQMGGQDPAPSMQQYTPPLGGTPGFAPAGVQAQQPMAQPQQMQPQAQVQRQELSDEQITAISLRNPAAAKLLQQQKDARRVAGEKQSDQAFQLAKPNLEVAQKIIAKGPTQEVLLDRIENDIASGVTSFGSADYFAEAFNRPELATLRGAELKSALKEQLVGSLEGIPGKGLNQFLEKRLADALPKFGQSKKANLAVVELAKSKHRVEQKKAEIINDLYEEQLDKYGSVRPNFNKVLNERFSRMAEDEVKFMRERMREIESGGFEGKTKRQEAALSLPEGRTRVRLPDGRTAHIPNEQVNAFIEQYKAEVM